MTGLGFAELAIRDENETNAQRIWLTIYRVRRIAFGGQIGILMAAGPLSTD